MIRIFTHTPISFTAVAAGMRPRASAWTTEAGLTVETNPNPIALALRHAP